MAVWNVSSSHVLCTILLIVVDLQWNSNYNKGMAEAKEIEQFDTDEDDFDTVMAEDLNFSGSIVFEKPFMIKGCVDGSIESKSDLLVDSNAVVRASISTDRVYIRGKVEGNINAARLIYVTSTGSVTGDITSAQVVLEPGSVFSGKCTMQDVSKKTARTNA